MGVRGTGKLLIKLNPLLGQNVCKLAKNKLKLLLSGPIKPKLELSCLRFGVLDFVYFYDFFAGDSCLCVSK